MLDTSKLTVNFSEKRPFFDTMEVDSSSKEHCSAVSNVGGKMKCKKRRRARQRKWCMDDFLDHRHPEAMSPPQSFPLNPETNLNSVERTSTSPRRNKRRPRGLRLFFGIPGAPHNTNEFIIEDKLQCENFPRNLCVDSDPVIQCNTTSEGESCPSSADETGDSFMDTSSFVLDEFEKEYESAMLDAEAKRNDSLTRTELLASFTLLSRRLSVLGESDDREHSAPGSSLQKLHEDLISLIGINRQLQAENQLLKSKTS